MSVKKHEHFDVREAVMIIPGEESWEGCEVMKDKKKIEGKGRRWSKCKEAICWK